MGQPQGQETGGTGSTDVPPRPEPRIEPPQPPPGGVDAVVEVEYEPGLAVPDPDPEKNPSTDDVPAETKQGEDTDTKATRGEAQERPEQESPA